MVRRVPLSLPTSHETSVRTRRSRAPSGQSPWFGTGTARKKDKEPSPQHAGNSPRGEGSRVTVSHRCTTRRRRSRTIIPPFRPSHRPRQHGRSLGVAKLACPRSAPYLPTCPPPHLRVAPAPLPRGRAWACFPSTGTVRPAPSDHNRHRREKKFTATPRFERASAEYTRRRHATGSLVPLCHQAWPK